MTANSEKFFKMTHQETREASISLSKNEFNIWLFMKTHQPLTDEILRTDATVSIQDLADKLKLRQALVKRHLTTLKDKGWLDIKIGTETATFLSRQPDDDDLDEAIALAAAKRKRISEGK